MRISDGSSDVCSSDLAVQPAAAERFAARLHYQHLDADAPDDYRRLKASLDGGAERITVFYLAMAPRYFGPVCRRLAEAGLTSAAARVVLEKPIGQELASAQAVNDAVGSAFPEARIFRIDHYLGKATVQHGRAHGWTPVAYATHV